MSRLFEIKSTKSVPIKNTFEILKGYISEAPIIINNQGMKISTRDADENTFTCAKFQKKKFCEYICYCNVCNEINIKEKDSDEKNWHCKKQYMIGINLKLLHKTIKPVTKDDIIVFYMLEDEDFFYVEITHPSIGHVKTVRLPILALKDKIFNLSDMDADNSINLPTLQFQQIIKDIHNLDGQIIEIKSFGKNLIFSCKDDYIQAHYEVVIKEVNNNKQDIINSNGNSSIEFKSSEDDTVVQGEFKLSYLLSFLKGSHLCENMNIILTNDSPLILDYYIADLGMLTYALNSI